eukprot:3836195-Pleurochrysis_carterae.AAC.1
MACERACTGASWAREVMAASVSSMCSRRASYECRRRRAGGSLEGTLKKNMTCNRTCYKKDTRNTKWHRVAIFG